LRHFGRFNQAYSVVGIDPSLIKYLECLKKNNSKTIDQRRGFMEIADLKREAEMVWQRLGKAQECL
jgi:hypothetical protein